MKQLILLITCVLFSFGAYTQVDLIETTGGLKVGNTNVSDDGTIRYNNNDLEGRVNGEWKSLSKNTVYTTSRTSLNTNSTNINDQNWHPVGPSTSFVKQSDETVLELMV